MNDLTAVNLSRHQLIGAYQQLPAIEQKILRLTAVIYTPVSLTNLLACYNRVSPIQSSPKSQRTASSRGAAHW